MIVSVVIPTAGALSESGKPLLFGALEAVHDADEVVVVVTGEKMTEEGAEALSYADAVVGIDGQFNFSRAVNAGVRATDGDWILLLNDDVALPRHGGHRWLGDLSRKRADVKGVCLVSPDEWTIEHAGVVFEGPGGLPCHRGWQRPASVEYADGEALAVTAAAMMIRRSVFDDLGGFDESFPINYGDVDFCLRARELGHRTMVYNSIRLTHREASTREPIDPVPDFRRLVEWHRDLLDELGIETDPDAALHHLTHIGLVQATA